MADTLEELYEKYNILSDAKENVSKHAEDYLFCLEGTKGKEKEKKLAAQIISKFYKHFPDLQEKAMDAIVDLCEDIEPSIRVCATKVLPLLCKDVKENLSKVANILVQLFQLDELDYNIASSSLIQLFKDDPLKVVKSVIGAINTDGTSNDENLIRERCIQFLYKKLVKMEDKLTPEIHDLLLDEGKKIIQDSSATEFLTVVPYLTSSKLTKTLAGQEELVNSIAERAELDKEFDPHNEGSQNADCIIMCVKHVLPLFSANLQSTKFLKYYCDQILGHWDDIANIKDGNLIQFEFLKQLAELSMHCGKLDTPSCYVVQIFDKLKKYMPMPPEDGDLDNMPNLDFTSVECLLFAFHRLARQCPDFLTADPAVLKDFRSRLTFFSRGVGGCKKSLEKVQVNDKEKARIAPVVLENITALIKDLFYTTPVYKCNVQLSFKTLDKKIKLTPEATTTQVSTKRHAPIQFDSSNGSANKQLRSSKGTENKLYTPPSGKFSSNFQNYDRGRGRGRGWRGTRGGRGTGRGNWRN